MPQWTHRLGVTMGILLTLMTPVSAMLNSPPGTPDPVPLLHTTQPLVYERPNGEICLRYPDLPCVLCVGVEGGRPYSQWRTLTHQPMTPEQCRTSTP